MYEFEVKNYNGGIIYEKQKFEKLDEIEQWLKDNKLSPIAWIDYKNKIMWVTIYSRFSQR